MSRWIAFDSQSAAVLATAQIVPELHDAGDALGTALSSGEKDRVLLLPARVPGRALVARIHHMPAATTQEPAAVKYEATGFLGLTDQPVYEHEPAPAKKWWQKFLD